MKKNTEIITSNYKKKKKKNHNRLSAETYKLFVVVSIRWCGTCRS